VTILVLVVVVMMMMIIIIIIIIKEGEVCVAVKPLIAYASPSVETLQGRDVTLMCVVLLGNPPPTITWYKMGERLTNHDDGNGHLSLADVGVADEGEYTCVASNAGGNATQTTQLDVHGMTCYISYCKDVYRTSYSGRPAENQRVPVITALYMTAAVFNFVA